MNTCGVACAVWRRPLGPDGSRPDGWQPDGWQPDGSQPDGLRRLGTPARYHWEAYWEHPEASTISTIMLRFPVVRDHGGSVGLRKMSILFGKQPKTAYERMLPNINEGIISFGKVERLTTSPIGKTTCEVVIGKSQGSNQNHLKTNATNTFFVSL